MKLMMTPLVWFRIDLMSHIVMGILILSLSLPVSLRVFVYGFDNIPKLRRFSFIYMRHDVPWRCNAKQFDCGIHVLTLDIL